MKDAESPQVAQEFAQSIRRDFGTAREAFDKLGEWLARLEESLRFAPESRGLVGKWQRQLEAMAEEAVTEADVVAKKLTNGADMASAVDHEHAARVMEIRRESA